MNKYNFSFLITLLFLNNFTNGMSRARRVLSRQIRPIATLLASKTKQFKSVESYHKLANTKYRPTQVNSFEKRNTLSQLTEVNFKNKEWEKFKKDEEKHKRTSIYENTIAQNYQNFSLTSLIYNLYKLVRKEMARTACHEAGHALVALSFPNPKIKITEISIIPQKDSAGRVNWEIIDQNFSKNDLLYLIKVYLAGKAAEELIFKEECHPKNDLENANKYAHHLICKFGMDKNLGNSQTTALKVEKEVKKLIQDNYDEVYKFLDENKDKLKKLAKALFIKEILTGDQALKIINK